MGFIPCKAEQPLQGMELQEKEAQKDSMQGGTATARHGVTRKRSTKRLKHTQNLFRKNLQLIGVC